MAERRLLRSVQHGVQPHLQSAGEPEGGRPRRSRCPPSRDSAECQVPVSFVVVSLLASALLFFFLFSFLPAVFFRWPLLFVVGCSLPLLAFVFLGSLLIFSSPLSLPIIRFSFSLLGFFSRQFIVVIMKKCACGGLSIPPSGGLVGGRSPRRDFPEPPPTDDVDWKKLSSEFRQILLEGALEPTEVHAKYHREFRKVTYECM